MSDITYLKTTTTHPIPPERVINGVDTDELSSVLVVGWDKENNMVSYSSHSDAAELLLLVETFKKILLDGGFERP